MLIRVASMEDRDEWLLFPSPKHSAHAPNTHYNQGHLINYRLVIVPTDINKITSTFAWPLMAWVVEVDPTPITTWQ